MRAGHTPGPWTLTHVSGSNFAVQRFELRGMFGDEPNVYPIFNRDTSAIDGGTFCASPTNARLISAAPDLLEAALSALELIEEIEDEEGFSPSLAFPAQLIRAAIRKATGADQ